MGWRPWCDHPTRSITPSMTPCQPWRKPRTRRTPYPSVANSVRARTTSFSPGHRPPHVDGRLLTKFWRIGLQGVLGEENPITNVHILRCTDLDVCITDGRKTKGGGKAVRQSKILKPRDFDRSGDLTRSLATMPTVVLAGSKCSVACGSARSKLRWGGTMRCRGQPHRCCVVGPRAMR